MKTRNKILTAGVLLAGLAVGAFQGAKYVNTKMGGRDPHVPHFWLDKNRCSGYARRAAEAIGGHEYKISDAAWTLAQANTLAERVSDGNAALDRLVSEGTLQKGHIVGVYNPSSSFNEQAKREGRPYTHAMVYMGNLDNDSDGLREHTFAHQYGTVQHDITETEMNKRGLQVIDVIHPGSSD